MSLFPRTRSPGVHAGSHAHDTGSDTGQEEEPAALVAALRTVAIAEVERRGLLLHLNRLPVEMTKPHHMRLIRTAVEPMMGADRARIFRLLDDNLVLLWRGEGTPFLRQTLDALEVLFADFGDDESGEALVMADIVTMLEVPRDSPLVLRAIHDSIPRGERAARKRAAAPPPLLPLTASALDLLERSLVQADVGRFARRTPICRVAENRAMRLQWEKRYLSISELTNCLIPDYSPNIDPWLYRRLTRTLERRMLVLLSDPDELRLVRPFLLNLNVSSILSPEFLKFDGVVPNHLRGALILAVQPADLLSDPASFCFARNFAHERGYRLLLHGLSADLVPVFPKSRIGVDMLQLRWSPEVAGLTAQVLADAAGDPQNVVLGGVDDIDALEWGIENAIGFFQGRLIHPSVPDPIPRPRPSRP
jgi:hypothetical protein